MSDRKGTMEYLAREASRAFSPLKDRLVSGQIRLLLWEIGMKFPASIDNQTNFMNSLADVVNEATQLPGEIAALNTAVQNDDAAGIATAVADLTASIVTIVTEISDIATELNNLQNAFSGINAADIAAFAGQLAERLLHYTLILYLENYHPRVAALLYFIGVIEYTHDLGDANDDAKPQFIKRDLDLSKLGDLLSDPSSLFQNRFGWGTGGFDGAKLIDCLYKIVQALRLPLRYTRPDGSDPAKLKLLFAELEPLLNLNPKGIGVTFEGGWAPNTTVTLPFIMENWNVVFDVNANLQASTQLIFQPGSKIKLIPPSGSIDGDLKISLVGSPPTGESEYILFGKNAGSRMSVGQIRASLLLGFSWNSGAGEAEGDYGIEVALDRGLIHIEAGDGDGFLQKVIPEKGLDFIFDLLIGWTAQRGFYFDGSAFLELPIPIHKKLGPVAVDTLYIQLGFDAGGLKPGVSVDAGVELGPFQAVVGKMGVSGDLKFQNGNLGPMDASVDFQPPKGIGLSLDATAVKGGGYLFFDFDQQRYAGVAELTVKEVISIKAIGLLTTILPGGTKGFSLLLMITAEFTPIQLGFGFTLNGVGGIIGVNRTMKLEVLRDGVKTGSFDHLLFPADPVGNATQIISELRAIFPPEEKRYVFGLMGLLGWGTPKLVDIKLGLMIEVPSPVRLALLGIVKVVLPDESAPILSLKVAFLGTIDFEKKQLAFDASLYDSRLLAFTLAGDMALRVAWGNNKNFVLSVGGFHPRYQPPPGLAGMQRLTISLLGGNNPRITITNYFAVTSNTVQFGARAELYVKVTKKLKIEGHMGFDALFQFSPFYFIISASASLGIYWKNKMVLGMSASVMLEGPTPWRVDAQVKIKIIFIKIKVKISRTWGDNQNTTLPNTTVYPRLKTALEDQANWSSVMPAKKGEYVQIKEIDPTDVLAHPLGVMQVSQKEVPLNLEVQKYGNQQASDKGKFEISEVKIAGGPALATNNIREDFAPSQYREMSETEKLSSPDFVKYDAGVSIKGTEELTGNYFVKREIQYESAILSGGTKTSLAKRSISTDFLEAHAKGGRAGSSALSFTPIKKSALAPEEITMLEENYGVVNISDMKLYDIDSMKPSFQEALDYLSNLVTGSPALRNDLQVVPAFEVAP